MPAWEATVWTSCCSIQSGPVWFSSSTCLRREAFITSDHGLHLNIFSFVLFFNLQLDMIAPEDTRLVFSTAFLFQTERKWSPRENVPFPESHVNWGLKPLPQLVLFLATLILSRRWLQFKSFHSISLQLLTTLLAAVNAVAESRSYRGQYSLAPWRGSGQVCWLASTYRASVPRLWPSGPLWPVGEWVVLAVTF